ASRGRAGRATAAGSRSASRGRPRCRRRAAGRAPRPARRSRHGPARAPAAPTRTRRPLRSSPPRLAWRRRPRATSRGPTARGCSRRRSAARAPAARVARPSRGPPRAPPFRRSASAGWVRARRADTGDRVERRRNQRYRGRGRGGVAMVTIEDVARRAGVAPSTVSYALSGKRSISERTRERVERAVAELGYRPHAGARALASARTSTLGLMIPLRQGVDVNVMMQFVLGIVTRAREFDHDVLLVTQDEDAGLERLTGGRMVDALILMDVEAADPRVGRAARLAQPTILIGLPDDPQGLHCVDFDFDAAARLAVRHLADLGHTSIGLVGPPPAVLERHTSFAERLLHGFREQVERSGVTGLVELTPPSHAGALAAVEALRGASEPPTALVVHNEAALPWVVDALQMH